MKFIIAVIKPMKLDAVRDGLVSIGVLGMTVSEVKGYGRQKGHFNLGGGREETVNFVSKAKIEVVVADDQADRAIKIIGDAARTGQIGDGKVFVLDLQQALRIRTGETGSAAL